MGKYKHIDLFKFKKKDKEDSKILYEFDLEKLELSNLAKEYSLEEGIKLLEEVKIKFNKEDIKFVIRDSSGELMWLEKGKNNSGYLHLLKHQKDFKKKLKVKIKNYSKFIKKILLKSKVLYVHERNKNGRIGLEKVYIYRNKFYILVAVGTNGFIISAYPISDSEYQRKLRKWRKEENEKREN